MRSDDIVAGMSDTACTSRLPWRATVLNRALDLMK